jgi:hypothetical protein
MQVNGAWTSSYGLPITPILGENDEERERKEGTTCGGSRPIFMRGVGRMMVSITETLFSGLNLPALFRNLPFETDNL